MGSGTLQDRCKIVGPSVRQQATLGLKPVMESVMEPVMEPVREWSYTAHTILSAMNSHRSRFAFVALASLIPRQRPFARR
jgi:hypothetical protein